VGTSRYLVMAWRMQADASNGAHRLYFGFWDETSSKGNLFRIDKAVTTATPVAGGQYTTGGYTGAFFHKDGAGPWTLNNTGGTIPPPLPAWLKTQARVDLFCHPDPMPGNPDICDEWGFRVRVPIDGAADVASDNPAGVKITTGGVYRFWYQSQNFLTLGTLAPYSWPETPVATEGPLCPSIPAYCFPNPEDVTVPWTRVQDGTTCTGDIGLAPSGMYVNTAGSNQVGLSGSNEFHAKPTNYMTAGVQNTSVKATFRIANWGSSIGSSPEWLPICTDQVGSAAVVGAGAQFDIPCSWTVPDPCAFKPAGDPCGASAGTRTVDQCLLVSLDSAGGGGPYFFSPDSAYRNMMFTGASRIEKTAMLDTKGLAPLAGGGTRRDLYVYVRTSNMPSRMGPSRPNPDLGRLPKPRQEALARLQLPKTGPVGQEDAKRIAAAAAAGQLSFDEVQALMPTYVAYVWHDTGKTIGAGPGVLKVLGAQPAFGIFAWHDGGLNGWKSSFSGSDITQIGRNLYKVSAPEGGTIRVQVRITACEWPICADHYLSHWWLILISLILLLLFAFVSFLLLRRFL
jgi:hypothetical protein